MPIYEYTCSNCGLKFELKRSLDEAGEKAPCPHCHNDSKRVISAFFPCAKDEFGQSAPLARPWRYIK